jgi:hypothetical protein
MAGEKKINKTRKEEPRKKERKKERKRARTIDRKQC